MALLFGLIALAWLLALVRVWRGMPRVPRLAEVSPLADSDCPTVSLLVPVRNEADKLPQSLPTMLAQDYPRYELILVDDRSQDDTPQILAQTAADPRVKAIWVAELPPGWLGKPHAQWRAYENASGDWLVFADADVRFSPDLLRRALALTLQNRWDHLTLLGLIDLKGFWEKVAASYLVLGGILLLEPWRVSDSRSSRYFGAGMFQLLRRSAYEALGTHRRLALEVVDDIKLGKLVKQGGFTSGVGLADDRLQLRWHDGIGNLIDGLTKNVFAALEFSLARVAACTMTALLVGVASFLALLLGSGLTRLLAGTAVLAILLLHGATARLLRVSPLYAASHWLGVLIFCYILLRSTWVTLRQGGIVWRGTFYSLEGLRKGIV